MLIMIILAFTTPINKLNFNKPTTVDMTSKIILQWFVTVKVNIDALSSPKMRFSIPTPIMTSTSVDGSSSSGVAEAADATVLVLPNQIESTTRNMSVPTTSSQGQTTALIDSGFNSVGGNNMYSYRSIILKKITQEGLKDVLKDGAKSKATATVTYKVMPEFSRAGPSHFKK